MVPPVVQITASYRGGNAQDLEKTVAQPIEQQLQGLDGLMYFFSRSSNDGVLTIDVTFELGTNVDLATVQTQNKVNLALPVLPPEVQRVGVTIKKVSSAILIAYAVYSPDDRYDTLYLNNYAVINLQDKIGSIPGVGDIRVNPGQNYGMRVWVNPDKMAKLGLTATDVANAILRAEPAESGGRAGAASGAARERLPVSGERDGASAAAGTVRRHRGARATGRVAAEEGARHRSARSWARRVTRRSARSNGKPSAILDYVSGAGSQRAVDTANRVTAFMERREEGVSRGAGVPVDLRSDAVRAGGHSRRGGNIVHRHRPGGFRGVSIPARLARDADSVADRAGFDPGNPGAVSRFGILHQHDQHVRIGAGDRHRGRRRDRGGGGGAAQP